MTRFIVLITKNENKKTEFEKQISRYGHEVIVDYESEHKDDLNFFVRKYLEYAEMKKSVLIAVVRERMEMLDSDGNNIYTKNIDDNMHLLPVINRSTLFYMSFRDKFQTMHQIVYSTKGYLNLKILQIKTDVVNESGFGWDNIFTDIQTHKTYHHLKVGKSISEQNDKISSRDHAIAEFIIKILYYVKKIDLFHNPQNFQNVVDFEKFEDVRRTVTDILNIQFDPTMTQSLNSVNNLSYLRNSIRNICNSVFNSGITFRSPENRRVKLSWMPGLNPGIPFTRKVRDYGQEATYMIHDFGHHVIPDLIYVKGDNYDEKKKRRNKRIYIMYRMMSEAITMIMADMFFVDGILGGKINYADVESRKIYPLYQAILKENHDRIDTVDGLVELNKDIIHANVTFVLSGKYDSYLKLLKTNIEPPVLIEFRKKYESFFVEDYRWTSKNYEYFEDIDMDIWYSEFDNCGLLDGMDMITVDEFNACVELRSNTFNNDIIHDDLDMISVIDPMFDSIYQLWLSNILHPHTIIEIEDENIRREKSFRRYMIGQMYIFYRMKDMEYYSNMVFCDQLLEVLQKFQVAGKIEIHNIKIIRAFYNMYLEHLRTKGILTSDDVRVYSEVYPILEPFIVNYQEPDDEPRDRLVSFCLKCLT